MFKNKNKRKFYPTPKNKGERLGWVAVKDAKLVSFREVLAEGEVIRLENGKKPLLVP